MKRTNIYLDESRLSLLRSISDARGEPVASLVREAIDEWLRAQGAREIDEDEWVRRWDGLLDRRRKIARKEGWKLEEAERDVLEEVRAVRRARAARRR